MSKQRSIEQHRRFFGLMAALYEHWPESHRFRPDNSEHLRAWLLVRAGHHVVNTYYLNEDASEFAKLLPIVVATMMRKHCWCRARGNELHVCVPLSISIHGPDSIGHELFCKINSDVDEVIRAETGLDSDELLREREKAA